MSAGSSPHSKEVDYCRPGVLGYIVHPSADAQLSDEHDLYGACTPKLGITRHYTPLKDHADVLHNAQLTPGGGEFTQHHSICMQESDYLRNVQDEVYYRFLRIGGMGLRGTSKSCVTPHHVLDGRPHRKPRPHSRSSPEPISRPLYGRVTGKFSLKWNYCPRL
jgi:hypothetical protein